ncbi:hypothetical protein QFZ74_001754 [Streptomyces sp. V3I7]|nr:hypothetical protein [Streptomyces sp. V3I7]
MDITLAAEYGTDAVLTELPSAAAPLVGSG